MNYWFKEDIQDATPLQAFGVQISMWRGWGAQLPPDLGLHGGQWEYEDRGAR